MTRRALLSAPLAGALPAAAVPPALAAAARRLAAALDRCAALEDADAHPAARDAAGAAMNAADEALAAALVAARLPAVVVDGRLYVGTVGTVGWDREDWPSQATVVDVATIAGL